MTSAIRPTDKIIFQANLIAVVRDECNNLALVDIAEGNRITFDCPQSSEHQHAIRVLLEEYADRSVKLIRREAPKEEPIHRIDIEDSPNDDFFYAKGHIDPVFFCERIEKEEEAKVSPKDVIHTYWRCIRDFEQDCVRLAPAQEGSKGGFAVTTNYDMSGDRSI